MVTNSPKTASSCVFRSSANSLFTKLPNITANESALILDGSNKISVAKITILVTGIGNPPLSR